MTQEPMDVLLSRLERVRRVGAGHVALCPAHDDHDPSLSIDPGREQPFVLRCRSAQCEPADILAAVDLTWADVCAPRDVPRSRPRVVAEYVYRNEDGSPEYLVKRIEPGRDGKAKSFVQYRPDGSKGIKGVRRLVYRLPEVLAAVDAGRTVFVVEGEKDADRLAALGEAATCNSGGTGNPWPTSFAEWFKGAEVVIVADRDEAGRKHARRIRDVLAPVARSVRTVQAAIERDKADVSDHLAAGHALDELVPVDLDQQSADPESRPAHSPPLTVEADPAAQGGSGSEDGKGRGPSQSAILVKLARGRFDIFMSDDGRPYAVRRDGANLALPLRGKAGLRSLLAKLFGDEQGGGVPSQAALTDAMTVLEGIAQSSEPRVPHLRTARHGKQIVIDLGTPDGRCVIVGPDGWSREPRSPVLFRRSGAMKALPSPVRDGDGLARLAALLNMDQDAFRLLVGWLVAAFIPDLPHPILTFRGEQGTGKSKAAQAVIGIIDPSGAPKRTAPRDVKSWATQAFNSWGLCIDNVSYIPDWLSDALCRAVTGDGIVDRALYTDDDVVVLEFRRVLALTTIDAGALAGDLAERLLTIELSLIPDHKRREEAELDRAYADAHAAILASLFDLLADVLRALPDVHLTERPRMADFARILAAVDKVKGWSTLDAYTAGARNAVADVLEGEPFAQAVVKLVDAAGDSGITVSAQQLLDQVDAPDRLPKKWPRDPTRAGGQLKRLAPALRAIGIAFAESRTKRGRFYSLAATPERIAANRESSDGGSPEREGAIQRHQRHQHPPAGGVTSANRGDASPIAVASPLPGTDGPGDADAPPASPTEMRPDLGKRGSGDAGDAGDGKTHLLSPASTGPCAKCGQPTHRYGPGGNAWCTDCRAANAAPLPQSGIPGVYGPGEWAAAGRPGGPAGEEAAS